MTKPRVIISTDIGGSDPDDMESMAHALLAADQWDIKALISTPTKYDGRTSDIYKALDAYTADYSNLKTWSDYPKPDYLKSVVYQGNVNVAPDPGYSYSTEASKAIINAAHDAKAAGEPLWVMTWGALTDVAQALHDDPSIGSTIRVLASNGWNLRQDPNAYDYVVNTHAKNGLWMIDSHSTHRGIYIDESGKENNPFNMDQARGHGELGDYFYWSRPWGVKMGDSWSIAYLTDKADNNNPQANSWGGEFVKNGKGPNYWTDDPDWSANVGGYKGAAHVREHQLNIYKDMYRLFDRAKYANPDADKDSSDSGGSSGSGGVNYEVNAQDDHYSIESGAELWQADRYLTWNDKGADGGLTVTQVDGTSANGVAVSWNNGTIVYRSKAGFNGTDTIGYTVTDADGSTDRAKMVITVGDPDKSDSGDTPTSGDSASGGSGNPVYAYDDTKYKLDPGETLWEAAHWLTANDKGADGGLNVTQVDGTSAQGVSVSFSNGTIVYKAKAGFVGVDTVGYTVTDKDGSSDRANMVITIGDPDSQPQPEPVPEPSAGSGNPVYAYDDTKYTLDPGETLWEAARYLTYNDKGADGGLTVTQVDGTSSNGTSVSFSNGTISYKAKAGFVGVDSIGYTVTDKDGSSDRANMIITVGDAQPQPSLEPQPEEQNSGSGNPVEARSDSYTIEAGKTLWVNSRFFTYNDYGPDGGLDVKAVDGSSVNGARISWGPEGSEADGTTVYRAPDGFTGTDRFHYTLVDADGSSDVGTVFVNVVDMFG